MEQAWAHAAERLRLMVVPTLRHVSVFDAERISGTPVHIIGCGATGSRVALGLAKLGIDTIHIYDYDVIEIVNLANQLFKVSDVGRPKVDALSDLVFEQTGTKVHAHEVKVEDQAMTGYVFLLTDTMASRKAIWQNCLKFNTEVPAVFETRFMSDALQTYVVDPNDVDSADRWEATLCDDENAAESACGTSITVGPTVDIVTGFVLWQFMRTVNAIQDRLDGVPVRSSEGEEETGVKYAAEPPPWRLMLMTRPFQFMGNLQ